MVPHLLTYPRSGSHYFEHLVYAKIGYRFKRSHTIGDVFDKNKIKTKTIITIARNPEESIRSLLTMQKEQGTEVHDDSIRHTISNYALLYQCLYNHADYVIDYNDLIKYPDTIVNKILNFLNIEYNKDSNFIIEDYKKFNGERWIQSSKKFDSYNEIKLDNFNIGLCYYEYNKLLEKKVIV